MPTVNEQLIVLQQETAAIQERIRRIESHLLGQPPDQQFTEYRGALFKRKPSGKYHEVMYCPSCFYPLSHPPGRQFFCVPCKITIEFKHKNIEDIVRELEKQK